MMYDLNSTNYDISEQMVSKREKTQREPGKGIGTKRYTNTALGVLVSQRMYPRLCDDSQRPLPRGTE